MTVSAIRGSVPPLVEFRSVAGGADAIWRGDVPPELQDYDVELEVPEQLRWGQDAGVDAEAAAGISHLGSDTRIVGRVLECDDVGVLSVEVAGTLIMVELTERPPANIAGANVSLRVRRLELYPSSL